MESSGIMHEHHSHNDIYKSAASAKATSRVAWVSTWGLFALAVAFLVLAYINVSDLHDWFQWVACILLLVAFIIWLFFLFRASTAAARVCA